MFLFLGVYSLAIGGFCMALYHSSRCVEHTEGGRAVLFCVLWNLMSNKNSWSGSNVQQASAGPARKITRPESMSSWNVFSKFTLHSLAALTSVQPWPIMSSTGCGRRGRTRAMAWRALLSRVSQWIWWRMRRRRGRGERWGPCTAQPGSSQASATAPQSCSWRPEPRW